MLGILGQTRLESLGERSAIEVFADEDERVTTGLAGFPFAIELGVEEHVHALEDEALVGAFHGEHALHAVDVAAFYAEEFADPLVEFFAVEVAGVADADGSNGFVVRVGRVEILLPCGARGFAHDVDMERVLAAGFEDEVEPGLFDFQHELAVALGEQEALERSAGDEGIALFQAGFPISKNVDRGVARGRDSGLGGGGGEVAVDG